MSGCRGRCSGPLSTWHGGCLGVGRMFSNLDPKFFPMSWFAKKKKKNSAWRYHKFRMVPVNPRQEQGAAKQTPNSLDLQLLAG